MFNVKFGSKEKFKGFILGVLVTSLLATSLFSFADMQNIEAFFNDIKIQINGKIIDTGNNKLFLYNGRTYVPTRYVAEGLGANVSWNESSNTVEISSVSKINDSVSVITPIPTVIPELKGSIKGTITWQYNDYVGTKGDTGASIVLIPENLKQNSENDAILGLSQGKNNIFNAKADGYGNYQIQDVPIGIYYLLTISANTSNNQGMEQSDFDILKPLLTERSMITISEYLKVFKYKLKQIEIKENKMITESWDFGNKF